MDATTATTFLNKSEIETLTGFKVPLRQIAQLKKQGIPFFTDRYNRPVVVRENLFGIGKKIEQPKNTPKWQPSVLKSVKNG
ncbi:MAG: DUF4224 domain-containing protein [Neisseriaceae bacterium]|nr:DUF4224 domain-containing protein [Neisseriaceae bacterium]